MLLQTGTQRRCAIPELPVREGIALLRITVKDNMDPVRMALHMPLQYINQCRRALRRSFCAAQGQFARSGQLDGLACNACALHGA